MALFLVKRVKKDDQTVDILLISSVDKTTIEKTMIAIYPEYDCEIPESTPEMVEQLFNEQYGGIAVLQTV